ncbi:unnamed protein product [Pieris macdunnoughi]|uniref:Uncharacterized protein n=1 Tax=Pieris macdunnoughi TaxID=345717 RepID=A0A821MRY7_9NEOP|nr:unnamed protein product [Pieris macdunnoughi]
MFVSFMYWVFSAHFAWTRSAAELHDANADQIGVRAARASTCSLAQPVSPHSATLSFEHNSLLARFSPDYENYITWVPARIPGAVGTRSQSYLPGAAWASTTGARVAGGGVSANGASFATPNAVA